MGLPDETSSENGRSIEHAYKNLKKLQAKARKSNESRQSIDPKPVSASTKESAIKSSTISNCKVANKIKPSNILSSSTSESETETFDNESTNSSSSNYNKNKIKTSSSTIPKNKLIKHQYQQIIIKNDQKHYNR
ncbi:unnamed protein product [Rotaria sordida]|uniref:Uncharacterized protein n=1 Tax=Rotaria sordida TaxID=392033 RepID=A0A816BWU2_9BILA|nr:unnamed protein product [Rotaria sordida]CAF1615036.1 unnamed protein product [Rotaria sordida]